MLKRAHFRRRVFNWFDQHGRKDLPWQIKPTPYRVWVSEIMLQQTQVSTVIPYFQRFMAAFPNIKRLSVAPLDEVLHLWTGLGYYARARNLHKTANIICEQYQANMPLDLPSLVSLPGIGRSTAGAILSLADEQAVAILDGNVKRVLARFHALGGWPGDKKVADQLWQVAESYIAPERARDYTQAMMDLGATVCTRAKPSCEQCPLMSHCQAYQQQTMSDYPGKKPKKALAVRQQYFIIFKHGQRLLLEKRPQSGLWGGLWSFPNCDMSDELTEFVSTYYTDNIVSKQVLPCFRHTFSHFHLEITPVLIEIIPPVTEVMDSDGQIWYNLAKPQAIGLSQAVKRIIKDLEGALCHE